MKKKRLPLALELSKTIRKAPMKRPKTIKPEKGPGTYSRKKEKKAVEQ